MHMLPLFVSHAKGIAKNLKLAAVLVNIYMGWATALSPIQGVGTASEGPLSISECQ